MLQGIKRPAENQGLTKYKKVSADNSLMPRRMSRQQKRKLRNLRTTKDYTNPTHGKTVSIPGGLSRTAIVKKGNLDAALQKLGIGPKQTKYSLSKSKKRKK